MKETRKLCIVGLGSIGAKHLKVAKDYFPDIDVCVLRRNKEESEGISLDKVFTGIKEAMDFGTTHFIIATPANTHISYIQELLNYDCQILVEKPLAMNQEEAQSLQTHKEIYIAYNLRFHPYLKYLKNFIQSKELGDCYYIRAEVGQYLPSWRPNSDYRTGVSAKIESGGGATMELSHEIDYVAWLFDSDLNIEYSSASHTGALDIETEDLVLACGSLNQGKVKFHIHLDFLRKQASRKIFAIFEKGEVTVDLVNKSFLYVKENQEVVNVEIDTSNDPFETYYYQLNDFLEEQGQLSDLSSATKVMGYIDQIKDGYYL